MQRALLQFRNPKKYDIVRAALVEANREDLIGFGPKCLIKPKEKKVDFERNHPRSKKPSTLTTKTNSKNTLNKNSKNTKNSDFDITNEDLLYAERKSSRSKKSTKSKSNKSFSKDSSKPTSKAKKSNSKNNSKPSGKSSYGKNPAGKKNTRAVPTRKGK
jgi:isochorismate synthase EntC